MLRASRIEPWASRATRCTTASSAVAPSVFTISARRWAIASEPMWRKLKRWQRLWIVAGTF